MTEAKNSFVQRLIGAAALDSAIYEDVESDRSATVQVSVVVSPPWAVGGGSTLVTCRSETGVPITVSDVA